PGTLEPEAGGLGPSSPGPSSPDASGPRTVEPGPVGPRLVNPAPWSRRRQASWAGPDRTGPVNLSLGGRRPQASSVPRPRNRTPRARGRRARRPGIGPAGPRSLATWDVEPGGVGPGSVEPGGLDSGDRRARLRDRGPS